MYFRFVKKYAYFTVFYEGCERTQQRWRQAQKYWSVTALQIEVYIKPVNVIFPQSVFHTSVGKMAGKNPTSFEGAPIKRNLMETMNTADTPSSALQSVDYSSGANIKLSDDILYKARNMCLIWQHSSGSTFVVGGLAVGRHNRLSVYSFAN